MVAASRDDDDDDTVMNKLKPELHAMNSPRGLSIHLVPATLAKSASSLRKLAGCRNGTKWSKVASNMTG